MTLQFKKYLLPALLFFVAATGSVMGQNEASKPKVYLVADAHLDTQWNWDIQTTISEYVWNTIYQNLFLLKKYPHYVFNFEGGVKYSWMKEYYPQEYEEMKKYITEGRWHISGASWDAGDVNVPSIESGIRNILLGQEYFRKEFGVESTDIFLPDCFGFGWTLPTIASHCGLIGFSSQKLGWRHNAFHDGKKYPFTVGLWKGVDGSSIMMAHGFSYGQRWNLQEDLSNSRRLQGLMRESPLNVLYHYYGTGDIGGSPTLNSVDAVERSLNGNGPLQIISATSDQLYKDYLPFGRHPELPVYDGELLMDVHGTGCYTSQAAMKFYNRQNEMLGDASERSSVAAEMLGLMEYPSSALTESWRRFIFHQFHDDLTGTSIPRAYEFSWNDELLSLKQFSDILTTSVDAVSGQLDTRVKGMPIVFYNALGFETTDLVEVAVASARCPKSVSVYDAQGKSVSSQLLSYADGTVRVLVEATVPANGYAVYDLRLSGSGRIPALNSATDVIENTLYKVALNAQGDITSIFDRKNNKELVKEGKVIRLALFTENESFEWPAWEILKKTIDATPISITDGVKMTLIENGSLRKTLCVEKQYGDSKFRQYIRLYEGALAERIDFYNEIDWQTSNALLKAEFPLNLDNEKATYNLGIGSVQRGNNTPTAYEVPSHYWADLTDKNGTYGVTIMNDSKYGWDKPDNNTLRLTLLHTPKTRNGYAYQDHQDLGYHTFTYSLVRHAGDLNKAESGQKADVLNQRIKAFATAKHNGPLGKTYSLASSDNKHVVIKALKKAESSDEYVVRVYETGGSSNQEATLAFAADILSAVEADGTEKTIGQAGFSGKQLQVSIKPNSIKTYKVKLAKQQMSSRKYEPLALKLDKKCFSWDQFGGDANFESGYAYAAELVPSELTANGVSFHLDKEGLLNGMRCEGDTLSLPANHSYNRLYVLAAAAIPQNSVKCVFRVGKSAQEIKVPSYTGFIGQWGHTGHTTGYLYDAEVAYVGTHRHSSRGNHPYEFTYMFKYAIDIPAKAKEVILPNRPEVVLFAATLAEEAYPAATAASELFHTANVGSEEVLQEEAVEKVNLLKPEHVVAWSGFTRQNERPAMMLDNREETKWCDISGIPSFVEFDLGSPTEISSWKMVNAAMENRSYVTSSCLLQARNDKSEEWRTIDYYTGNQKNVVQKKLGQIENVRYLRLYVIQPTQTPDGKDTRIYEFAVYK
jgi:alpha-mannosidase